MEVTQLDIGGLVLRRRFIPTEDTYFYGDSFLRRRLISTEAYFYAGDWFPRRTLILTRVTHFHGVHLFFAEETYFYESNCIYGVDSFQRRRLTNELPVIESLCFRKDFLESPRGEHCNSLENGRFDHLYVHILCRTSLDLPFLDKILQEFEEKSGSSKAFGFFSTKYLLT